jgi:hypothetical protein
MQHSTHTVLSQTLTTCAQVLCSIDTKVDIRTSLSLVCGGAGADGGAPAPSPTAHLTLYSAGFCPISLQARKQAEEAALRVVHQHFRPEFLNRIDETVVFEALSPAQLREIARLQVRTLASNTKPLRLRLMCKYDLQTCTLPASHSGSC